MSWSEADSKLFIDEGDTFVPERALQIRIVCDLIPPANEPIDIVELCCGEGLLTKALLARFPQARVHAYDGSSAMLESTRKGAEEHLERLETERFDLAAEDWRRFGFAPHAVVTSLAVHHLDGPQKQSLFRDLAREIAPGGRFVLADLMAPQTAEGVAVAAESWDEAVKARALERDGDLAAFERFRAEVWNLYSDPDPDPVDKPSALFDQMKWLDAAGFAQVDLHWMRAGHAIISAVNPPKA